MKTTTVLVQADDLLAATWLLLDYPWGLLAFVAIAALYGLRRVTAGHYGIKTARAARAGHIIYDGHPELE